MMMRRLIWRICALLPSRRGPGAAVRPPWPYPPFPATSDASPRERRCREMAAEQNTDQPRLLTATQSTRVNAISLPANQKSTVDARCVMRQEEGDCQEN